MDNAEKENNSNHIVSGLSNPGYKFSRIESTNPFTNDRQDYHTSTPLSHLKTQDFNLNYVQENDEQHFLSGFVFRKKDSTFTNNNNRGRVFDRILRNGLLFTVESKLLNQTLE